MGSRSLAYGSSHFDDEGKKKVFFCAFFLSTLFYRRYFCVLEAHHTFGRIIHPWLNEQNFVLEHNEMSENYMARFVCDKNKSVIYL